MKDNNISIYLRKETYTKYKQLTDIMEIPLSSFIAQTLQTPEQMKVIDNLIEMAKLTKESQANGDRKGQ